MRENENVVLYHPDSKNKQVFEKHENGEIKDISVDGKYTVEVKGKTFNDVEEMWLGKVPTIDHHLVKQ